MRALSFLLLLLSTQVFAQDFDARLKALEKTHSDEDFELRKKTNFEGKYPNDDYVKAYPGLNDQHLAQILKLYDDECAKSKTQCLSDADKNLKSMQTRISNGLVAKRNQWAKEGVTPEERKKKEEEYKREVAGQDAGKKPDVVVTPDKKPDVVVTPDKKPDVVVTPDGKKDDPKPDPVSEELTKQMAEINKAIGVMTSDWTKKYEGGDKTKDAIDAIKAIEDAKLNMTLTLYKNLCEKYPKNETACLKPELIDLMKDGTESVKCLYDRKGQFFAAKDKSKVKEIDEAKHNEEWKAMNPKDCKKLLAADLVPEKKDDPVVTDDIDQESEDKRNYKSAECKWVVNMPRKVVTGASCGKSKNNICVGYVSCPRKTGAGSFTRMSTCRASYCGNEDAVKCTQDPGYWSRKPNGEDKEFVSPEVKKILRTSRQ